MREFLKDVWMHGGEESRAITPENITGEKGRAAMSASHFQFTPPKGADVLRN